MNTLIRRQLTYSFMHFVILGKKLLLSTVQSPSLQRGKHAPYEILHLFIQKMTSLERQNVI
jgi:hypothetical protein